jgi:hypothetical protein
METNASSIVLYSCSIANANESTDYFRMLGETERLEELAGMLRGETTRQEAAAMLEAARRRC